MEKRQRIEAMASGHGGGGGDDDDDDDDDDDEDAGAMPELARWCRAQLREGSSMSRELSDALRAAAASAGTGTCCPQRMLSVVATSDAGRTFLSSCMNRYTEALHDLPPGAAAVERSRLHAALGSVHEALGRIADAVAQVRLALIADGLLSSAVGGEEAAAESALPCFGASPLDTELRRALDLAASRRAAVRARLSTLIRLRRQQRADAARAAAGARPRLGVQPATPWPMPRAEAGLSVREFQLRHGATGTPVVLRLPPGAGPTPSWGLDYLSSRLRELGAELKQRVEGSVHWAGLEPAPPVDGANSLETVGEFIGSIRRAAAAAPAAPVHRYLFDWSMPQHCPELLDELTVPRYFASDLLQRAPPGSLLREAWPSLFVGGVGSSCSLHVDAYATHFWMLVCEGRKKWTIFPRSAAPLLRPSYAHGHDAVFGEAVEGVAGAGDGDGDGGGGWRSLERWECELCAGELLFVPAGCPHQVSNLQPNAAISANFVDRTNLDLAVDELQVAGLSSQPAAALAKALRQLGHGLEGLPEGEAGQVADPGQDLTWASFKRLYLSSAAEGRPEQSDQNNARE